MEETHWAAGLRECFLPHFSLFPQRAPLHTRVWISSCTNSTIYYFPHLAREGNTCLRTVREIKSCLTQDVCSTVHYSLNEASVSPQPWERSLAPNPLLLGSHPRKATQHFMWLGLSKGLLESSKDHWFLSAQNCRSWFLPKWSSPQQCGFWAGSPETWTLEPV